jgi:Zn-dependent peptidase ImmA (M78 family)
LSLRRGFRTEANDHAREVRRELRLALHDPLDPWRLAAHLEIPVHKLSDLPTEVAHHFLHLEASAFSAVTVFRSNRRVIVHNDAHNAGRQASDISHELGHGLLLHRPTPALSVVGCRDWDPVLEEEADWLGAALLVSDDVAMHIAQSGMSNRDAAMAYGVSLQLVTWRMNMTAARKRVARVGRPALSSTTRTKPVPAKSRLA